MRHVHVTHYIRGPPVRCPVKSLTCVTGHRPEEAVQCPRIGGAERDPPQASGPREKATAKGTEAGSPTRPRPPLASSRPVRTRPCFVVARRPGSRTPPTGPRRGGRWKGAGPREAREAVCRAPLGQPWRAAPCRRLSEPRLSSCYRPSLGGARRQVSARSPATVSNVGSARDTLSAESARAAWRAKQSRPGVLSLTA